MIIKKKIAVVYWTYDKDYDLILMSLIGTLKLQEKYNNYFDIDIYIFDDANHACTLAFPSNINYKQTTFNRNRNLNGIECCYEILKEYTELAKTYDWIFKIDSDTYVNNIDMLLNLPSDIGMVGSNNNANVMMGNAVFYSANAINYLMTCNFKKILVELNIQRDIQKFKRIRACDDAIFNSIIRDNFKCLNIPVSNITPNVIGSYNGILQYNNKICYRINKIVTKKQFLEHYAITFKHVTTNINMSDDLDKKYRDRAIKKFQYFLKVINS